MPERLVQTTSLAVLKLIEDSANVEDIQPRYMIHQRLVRDLHVKPIYATMYAESNECLLPDGRLRSLKDVKVTDYPSGNLRFVVMGRPNRSFPLLRLVLHYMAPHALLPGERPEYKQRLQAVVDEIFV